VEKLLLPAVLAGSWDWGLGRPAAGGNRCYFPTKNTAMSSIRRSSSTLVTLPSTVGPSVAPHATHTLHTMMMVMTG
jgi:hypothetical protein